MSIKKKTSELGDQMLTIFTETKKCIKEAQDPNDKMFVRELLNAIALFHGELEECYKHPENIEDVKFE